MTTTLPLAVAACAGGLLAGVLLARVGAQRPAPPTAERAAATTLTRIGFGSCLAQAGPQGLLLDAAALGPQLFLLLGDNIYADTEDPVAMRATYDQQLAGRGMQALAAQCPILAVWDDHDYGANDAGAEFVAKDASQRAFCDAWGYGGDAPRRQRRGTYDAVVFGPEGRRVQVILLDTRYHRTALQRVPAGQELPPGVGPYVPTADLEASILGDAQWEWLEQQLLEPADLRVVCSSIQFVADEHGWECWGNMPNEKARMLALLARTKASGVVFLSGDRHTAEISRLPPARDGRGPGYGIWDITSSSFNRTRGWQNEVNRHRRSGVFWDANFGTLEVDWDARDPTVHLRIYGAEGKLWMDQPVPLSSLQVPPDVAVEVAEPVQRIAFVSCIKQDQPQPMWRRVIERDPEVLLMLGDNIYADTVDMEVVAQKYATLNAQPDFASLRERIPVFGTWDDHDFGYNDIGSSYPMIEESKALCLDFFRVPQDDPRRQRPGIYHAVYFGPPEQRVQVVLLDTRTFRTPLAKQTVGKPAGSPNPGNYFPLGGHSVTMLGEAQWAWLEETLRVPAAVRLICSSIQVLSEGHNWECWANMPDERERMFRTIAAARASGVVFLSGDMHIAEHMVLPAHLSGVPYALHEFTSSGLNQGWEFTNYHNEHRVGAPMFEPNVGLVELDWGNGSSAVPGTRVPTVRITVERQDGAAVRGALPLPALRW